MVNLSEMQLAVFDIVVDTLLDLAEVSKQEEDEIRESLESAAEIIIDRLGLIVVGVDEDNQKLIANIDIIGDSVGQ